METVIMDEVELSVKTVAIVKFGPATPMDGMRPAEYYQVTIDPAMVSPSGEYIRFGKHPGDELIGWQKVYALTVVELLGEWDGDSSPLMKIGVESVAFRKVITEE